MKISTLESYIKPLTRGYIHQAAFCIALIACCFLLFKSRNNTALICNSIYTLTLTGLFAISAIYHIHLWSRRNYLVMKSLDHAAIYALIAGSATPICVLGLKGKLGCELFMIIWFFAILGMLLAVFWVRAPKWVRAFFYIALGWVAIPFLPELHQAIGTTNMVLLLTGGVLYTIGALVYAFKSPNPFPRIFGYHEIFHLFVVAASACHFKVIYTLTT